MNVLQHTRNELNLCLKENRPDRSYRDTLLKTVTRDYRVLEGLKRVTRGYKGLQGVAGGYKGFKRVTTG